MYINVAYKDPPELSLYRSPSKISQVDLLNSMTEKYLLVNPKCPVRIMLEYIRNKCKLALQTHFDLCDENGIPKNLFGYAPHSYATQNFEDKKTYYLIVIKREPDKTITILPQLCHDNKLYLDLQTKFRRCLTSGDIMSPQQNSPQPKSTSTPQSSVVTKKK